MPGVPAAPPFGGAVVAPGNPLLPPAPLLAYVVPSPAHGEIGRTVTSLHGGDLGRFLVLINTEMANMNHMLTDATGAGLLAHALGVQTSPCANKSCGNPLHPTVYYTRYTAQLGH
jgi:hypothetical protein